MRAARGWRGPLPERGWRGPLPEPACMSPAGRGRSAWRRASGPRDRAALAPPFPPGGLESFPPVALLHRRGRRERLPSPPVSGEASSTRHVFFVPCHSVQKPIHLLIFSKS